MLVYDVKHQILQDDDNMKTYQKLALSIVTTCFVGCASITQGTTQTISIIPKQTCVAKTHDGSEVGSTDSNGAILVHKSKNPIVIECKDKQPKTIESKISKVAAVGAVLLDGGLVDMLTGAMWMYESTVEVTE
jgi:hypothetical protein